jgi:flagella basal body P-ring formation protein FlgA
MNWALRIVILSSLAVLDLIAGLSPLSFASGESSSVTIDINPTASVSGSRIYLSDVANCEGLKTLCREITGIDVATSPAPGRSQFIQQAVIRGVLQKEWPKADFLVTGAESVRVEASSIDLSTDDVRVKLQSAINERLREVKDQVRVQIQRIQSPSLKVRPTQTAFDFSDLAGIAFDDPNWLSKNLVGNRPFTISIYNPADPDDKSNIQTHVTFSVDRHLPVLKKHIPVGQIIGESQVTQSWITMRRGLNDFIQTSDSLIGKKVKLSISQGEPVPSRFLESPMAVGRNQIVKMIVRKGDLEIAAKAKTIDQGAVGETVQVVNMANKMRMRAKVIDDRTVEAVSF